MAATLGFLESEPGMKDALFWWCDHLCVAVGGLFIGAEKPWLGIILAAIATYLILQRDSVTE